MTNVLLNFVTLSFARTFLNSLHPMLIHYCRSKIMMISLRQRKDEFTFRTSEATTFCMTQRCQTSSEYNMH